jgi:pyruvate formate lyase activating enzyme
MLIGGYQPCSLCDYPGHVAAVIFTQGCNFRCPFCHNGALLPATAPAKCLLSVDEILDCLRQRHGQLDAVVISGGEPTLHADLPDVLQRIRALDFAIKLDTNGSHPAMLRALLQARQVDYVAMDVKAPWEKYDTLTGVRAPTAALQESVRLLAQSGLPYEFRTTMVATLLSEDDLTAICTQLPPGATHRVQPFRAAHALDARLRHAIQQ